MFDPTLNARPAHSERKGAIMPLFAIFLALLLILSGYAINLAYMQKVSTELKIATDCAAHAAGRAMSIHQTTDAAIEQATVTAMTNRVAGKVIDISVDGNADGRNHIAIEFGKSIRANNGYGKYEFTGIDKALVDNGTQRATSVSVDARVKVPLVFQAMNYDYFGGNMTEFNARRKSIATQIDRDIALVLDRSGSMLYYKDHEAMSDKIYDLYNEYRDVDKPGHWKYGHWYKKWKWGSWRYYWRGYYSLDDAPSSYVVRDWNDKQWVPPSSYSERKISWNDYQDADDSLYNKDFSNDVIYELEVDYNDSHTLGDSFSSSEGDELTSPMAIYAYDWEYNSSDAPRHSRWHLLTQGVDAFLDILDITDQEERCSLITFASSSRLDYNLQMDYDVIRTEVDSIKPYGGTAIGDGMLEGVPPIVSGPNSRLFAAKTIVVLTDGENNSGEDPEVAVADIISDNNVTIHTVTFTPGADQEAMQNVAEDGYGRHYHADDGDALVAIFEEIANNLPTILTE